MSSDLRLRARVLAVRAVTALALGACIRYSGAMHRLLCELALSTGADKLVVGRRLLGPGATFILALVLDMDVRMLVCMVGSGTSKLGMGRQLLGPGSLLLALLCECAGCRGRVRQANPDLAWI